VGGVAVAVAVLVGSLVVGDSVRGSLRDIALERLGGVTHVVSSAAPFTDALGSRLAADEGFGERHGVAASILLVDGAARRAGTKLVVPHVTVIGVDEGFWRLGQSDPGVALTGRSVLLNRALADDLGVGRGDAVLLALARQSVAPAQSVFGRRDREDTVASLRVEVAAVLDAKGAGRFSLRGDQRVPRNCYISLSWLQEQLGQDGRANRLLVSAADEQISTDDLVRYVGRVAGLGDYGLKLTSHAARGYTSLEHDHLAIPEAVCDALLDDGSWAKGAIATSMYLANSLRLENRGDRPGRSVPYSVVAGMDLPVSGPMGPVPTVSGAVASRLGADEIVLNSWTADEMGAKVGDRIEMRYFVAGERGELREESRSFVLRGILAMTGLGADPELVPDFEGITDADTMGDWDPPFPLDTSRIGAADEEYWDVYGAAPKAFVAPATARQMWLSGLPRDVSAAWRTSLLFPVADDGDVRAANEELAQAICDRLAQAGYGFTVQPARDEALEAAKGSTDFGVLFVSMSMFLVISAAALIALLCRLTIERRAAQYGVMIATGIDVPEAARVLTREGFLLSALGTMLGIPLGLAYAQGVILALGTWWRGAVADLDLALHARVFSVLCGALAGLVVSVVAVRWAARMLRHVPALTLLSGWRALESAPSQNAMTWGRRIGAAGLAVGALLVLCGLLNVLPDTGAFFGGGAALMVGGVGAVCIGIQRSALPTSNERLSLLVLAWRGASRNWLRSLLIAGLVASASFVIVAVAANQRDVRHADTRERRSGSGGFSLLATCDVPLHTDLNTRAGRESLAFDRASSQVLNDANIVSLRMTGGDDASCLNMQQPKAPRVLGVPDELIVRDAFAFVKHVELPVGSESPWDLLVHDVSSGGGAPVVPAFADAASAQWILKVDLGEDVIVPGADGKDVRLRLVGLLAPSVFASELLVSDANFQRHLGSDSGYRYFLIETPAAHEEAVRKALSENLGELGLDVRRTSEVLASFARVQNTYLATFRTLGGLGLLLGTFGVVTVLLRGVLERRNELAMMLAVGLRRSQVAAMIVLENGILLIVGVVLGTLAAVIAVAPHLASALADVNWLHLGVTLGACVMVGLVSCGVAAFVSVKQNLLSSLRAE